MTDERWIAVVGTGYVGLTTGACFAEMGNDVVCVDIDQATVDALQRGEVPFFEPGLGEMVTRNVATGRLRPALCTASAPRDGGQDGGGPAHAPRLLAARHAPRARTH